MFVPQNKISVLKVVSLSLISSAIVCAALDQIKSNINLSWIIYNILMYFRLELKFKTFDKMFHYTAKL